MYYTFYTSNKMNDVLTLGNHLGICALFFDLRLWTDDDVERAIPRLLAYVFHFNFHPFHTSRFHECFT